MSRFLSLCRANAWRTCRHSQVQATTLRTTGFVRRVTTAQEVENTNVGHSKFISEATAAANWEGKPIQESDEASDDTKREMKNLAKGKGKITPTSSHLFKLILPLADLKTRLEDRKSDYNPPPPTILLLHPSQPLSHCARLIAASLAPATPKILFRSGRPSSQHAEWADSTDIGDFVRDAARASSFTIAISKTVNSGQAGETTIEVEVPTFADRTQYLRRKLSVIAKRLTKMEELKTTCDREAHKGARRMALGGFGILVTYWCGVAGLTYFRGWELVEPLTYLSGLSTVMCGYLWFLYQGREVSYSAVLSRSVSSRRNALYKERGLDIDLWADLVSDAKRLRREIRSIAEDYEEEQEGKADDDDGPEDDDDDDIPGPEDLEEHVEKKKDKKIRNDADLS